MPNSLRSHESQHARPPCPSPTPRVHSDSRPSSQWCHPASHPLSSPSLLAHNPSPPQSLFQWVNSSHEVAKVWSLNKDTKVNLRDRKLSPFTGLRAWPLKREKGGLNPNHRLGIKLRSLQYRRLGSSPWVRKISWRREWLPIQVFLPGECYGHRSLVSYSP